MKAVLVAVAALTTPTTTEGFGPIVTLSSNKKSPGKGGGNGGGGGGTAQNYVDERWHVLEPEETEPLPLPPPSMSMPLVDFDSDDYFEVDDFFNGRESRRPNGASFGGKSGRGGGGSLSDLAAAVPSRGRSANEKPSSPRVPISGRDRRASRDGLVMFAPASSPPPANDNRPIERIAEATTKEFDDRREQFRNRRREVITGREARRRRASRANFSPIAYEIGTPMLPPSTTAGEKSARRSKKDDGTDGKEKVRVKTPSEVLRDLDSISYGLRPEAVPPPLPIMEELERYRNEVESPSVNTKPPPSLIPSAVMLDNELLDSISAGFRPEARKVVQQPVLPPSGNDGMNEMPFPEGLPPHLFVRSVPGGRGAGVFTDVFIPRGDIVSEYVVEAAVAANERSDGEDDGGSLPWARFVNHASPPYDNVVVQEHEGYNGDKYVWLIAAHDIEPGNEIRYDYGDDYWL